MLHASPIHYAGGLLWGTAVRCDMLRRLVIDRLPPRFRWTLHNTFGHTFSELFFQLGWMNLSERVHDGTLPSESED